MALVSIPLPVAILFSSRRVTGGAFSVEMIYARAFLVGDLLLSTYGIMRPLQSWLGPRWADCLLAETLVCSEVLSRCATLTCGAVDSRLRSRGYRFAAKSSTTFALILLWNASVATGFLPVFRPRPKGCDPYSVLGTAYLGALAGIVVVSLTVASVILTANVRNTPPIPHPSPQLSTQHINLDQPRPQKDPLIGLLWVELRFLAAYGLPCIAYSIYVYAVYPSAKRAYYMIALSTLIQSKPLMSTLVRYLANRKLSAIVRGIFRPSTQSTPPTGALAYVIRGVVNEAFVGGGQGDSNDETGAMCRNGSNTKSFVQTAHLRRYINGRQRSKSVGTPVPKGYRGENGLFPKLRTKPLPLYDPWCPLHGTRSRKAVPRLAPVLAINEKRKSRLCDRVNEIRGARGDNKINKDLPRDKVLVDNDREYSSHQDSCEISNDDNTRDGVCFKRKNVKSNYTINGELKVDKLQENSGVNINDRLGKMSSKVKDGDIKISGERSDDKINAFERYSDINYGEEEGREQKNGEDKFDILMKEKNISEVKKEITNGCEDSVLRHPRTLEVRKLDRKNFLFPGSV